MNRFPLLEVLGGGLAGAVVGLVAWRIARQRVGRAVLTAAIELEREFETGELLLVTTAPPRIQAGIRQQADQTVRATGLTPESAREMVDAVRRFQEIFG